MGHLDRGLDALRNLLDCARAAGADVDVDLGSIMVTSQRSTHPRSATGRLVVSLRRGDP
jgi:hypothetical protein